MGNADESSLAKLIEQHGYPVEIHDDIATEDGYVLTSYRIPPLDTPKPVVLLIHGLLTNSADYVVPGPKRALGLVLSDHGYDVWLINLRGTRESRKHVTFTADTDEQYWKFSFHELGVYDIPAVLNRIEEVTGLRTVVLIGHSLGSILPYVLLAQKPEYNERFNLIVSLSPPVIVPNMGSLPYQFMNRTRHVWLVVMEMLGKLEWPPRFVHNLALTLWKRFGDVDGWYFNMVVRFLYVMHGKTPEQLVKEDLHRLMRYLPNSTSALVIKHLGQIYREGMFVKLDHGPQKNFQLYGAQKPPTYDLGKITSPVVLFCSSGDVVVLPKDARLLSEQLPNCVAVHQLDDPKFSHSDFLLGKYATTAVHPLIVRYLSKYCKLK